MHTFGSQQVLRQLDWQLEQGSVTGLLGRNGAGNNYVDGGLVRRWPALRNFWRTMGLRVGHKRVSMSPGDLTQYALGISVYGVGLFPWFAALSGWAIAGLLALLSDQLSMAWSRWPYIIEMLVTLAVPGARQSLMMAILRRSGEQSLLRLAPGAPTAAAINAMFARMLAKGFALLWLSAMACELLAQGLT